MDRQTYALALSRVNGVGPIQFKRIVQCFGGVEAAFDAGREQWSEHGFPIPVWEEWRDGQLLESSRITVETHRAEGIHCLGLSDPEYPFRLRQIPDPPPVLFVRGALPQTPRVVGIVGTRRMTEYGEAFLERLIPLLRELDLVVVSGMAHGVDGWAHGLCVREGIPTVGVLTHGLDRVYPARHRKLAHRMVTGAGALVTEFPLGTEVHPGLFPRRNRILAGLVDVLLVVESAAKGGALITARLANDYDREVLAVPGGVDRSCSRGCHALIKAHRAHLMDDGDDLLRVMNWDAAVRRPPPAELSKDERDVLQILDRFGNQHFDQLSLRLQLSPAKLAGHLLRLELKKCISSLPGNRYRSL